MFKCDVYAQILVDQTQKRFLSVLYVFESDFFTFVSLIFDQNAFLCFSSKTGSEVVSREARYVELLAKAD